MERISQIDKANDRNNLFHKINFFILKITGGIEILIILLLWFLVFFEREMLGSFSRQDFITYILVGSIIGLLASFFLRSVIVADMKKDGSEMLVFKPFKFFYRVVLLGLGKNFMPFVLALSFHALLLYFLVDNFTPHFEATYLALLAVMILLAFVSELLLAYLIRFFIFWTIENDDAYRSVVRLMKIFAGAYFPLSILPGSMFKIALFLPFAYSFYVPTQLYLKQISINDGLRGLLVQVFWITVFFVIIKISWKNRLENKKQKPAIVNGFKEIENKYITRPLENFDKKL